MKQFFRSDLFYFAMVTGLASYAVEVKNWLDMLRVATGVLAAMYFVSWVKIEWRKP